MTKGERIRQLRESLNISQTDLATKIGVSKQTLYKYENNIVTNIPSDKIEALANALHVQPSYIMDWEHKPAAPSEGSNEDIRAQRFIERFDEAIPEIQEAVRNLLKFDL